LRQHLHTTDKINNMIIVCTATPTKQEPSQACQLQRSRSVGWCVASWSIVVSVVHLETCRAGAPPLETPFADWDRGAGEGVSCSYVQDGRSGDHVPYFRWSGDQTPVCQEPARDPGNSPCMQTTLRASRAHLHGWLLAQNHSLCKVPAPACSIPVIDKLHVTSLQVYSPPHGKLATWHLCMQRSMCVYVEVSYSDVRFRTLM